MNTVIGFYFVATGLLMIGYVDAIADSCVVCDSDSDITCVQDPASILTRNCRTGDSFGCYSRIVGTRTLRGCVDELDEGVTKTCRSEINCEVCQSLGSNSGCNANIYPIHRITCHQCSGDLNSNCSNTENGNPKACRTYMAGDRCYIRKTKENVERGCLSETSRCPDAKSCFFCDGHGCNFINANSSEIPLSSAAIATPSICIALVAAFIASRIYN